MAGARTSSDAGDPPEAPFPPGASAASEGTPPHADVREDDGSGPRRPSTGAARQAAGDEAAGPGTTASTSSEPSAVEPSAVEPSSAEPSSVEPSSVEPARTLGPGAAAWVARGVTMVLLALLGFGGVVAVRSADPSSSLATASPERLAARLRAIGADDRSLAAQEDRLRGEAAALASPLAAGPRSGADAGQQGAGQQGAGQQGAASAGAARARADELAVLAGTVPVRGPGLELTIRDPHRSVEASVLVDALQELRDAGAEAIEISGVRTAVSTYIADSPGHGLVVDGTSISAPYVVTAIGDAHTLDQALRIPGGVLDTVASRDGAQAGVQTSGDLEIKALRAAPTPRYARPAG